MLTRPSRFEAEPLSTAIFIELVAYVGDQLSYQEEIANEGYLRTPAERASVRCLTRLLSYRLSNGVTAGVAVQFGIVESCHAGPLAARTHMLTRGPMLEACYRLAGREVGHVTTDARVQVVGRPQGVRAVRNPLPSDGASDPENPEPARRNPSGRVLALRLRAGWSSRRSRSRR